MTPTPQDLTVDLKFEKDATGRWYIVLPEYLEQGGMMADLQMVCGADTLLDILAERQLAEPATVVEVSMVNYRANGVVFLTKLRDGETEGGAYYSLKQDLRGQSYDFELWLCDVTKFVIGSMPETIMFMPK